MENQIATVQAVLNDLWGVAAGFLEFAELPIFDAPPPPIDAGQNLSPTTETTLFYEILSLVGTIISDVQGHSSNLGTGGRPNKQTLGQISQPVGVWKSKAEGNNAQAETQLLSDWDLFRTQSQRIASNMEDLGDHLKRGHM